MGKDIIIAYRPAIGNVITNPHNGIKYILEKVIGTSGYDFVYKASYYKLHYSVKDNLLPSGYVTVKYLRPGPEINRSLTQEETPDWNTIKVHTWFIRRFTDGFCAALPYMSEGSLRYILSTRFHYGLPEDCIAIALKEALQGLNDIHNSHQVHKCFTAGNIFVNFKRGPLWDVEIKLAFAATNYESDLECPIENVGGQGPDPVSTSVPSLELISEWAAAPEIFSTLIESDADEEICQGVKSDVWLVGIAALELAYGNIKVNSREEFEAMIDKIRKSKRLPDKLEFLVEEINATGKIKKVVRILKDKMILRKNGERMFSKEFEELVLDCLSSKPLMRPTVENLLKRPFFENAKDLKHFQRCVLHGKNPLPTD